MSTQAALWEIEQIKQLKACYFRFLDEHRWDDLRHVFTEDVRVIVDLDPRGENCFRVDNIDDFISHLSAVLLSLSLKLTGAFTSFLFLAGAAVLFGVVMILFIGRRKAATG